MTKVSHCRNCEQVLENVTAGRVPEWSNESKTRRWARATLNGGVLSENRWVVVVDDEEVEAR